MHVEAPRSLPSLQLSPTEHLNQLTRPDDLAGGLRCKVASGGMENAMDLHAAADAGLVLVVRTLVEQGADVHAQDARGRRPLHRAARGGHVAVLRELAELAADVNAQAVDGVTPLHLAEDGGHVESARALLELGANV
jgi:ankyrin repeat protein